MNDLLKRRGFVVKHMTNNSIDCDLNIHNNNEVLLNKQIINNKLITNESIELSTNSLISNSPLHLLIPYPSIDRKNKQLIKEKNLKVINAKFDKSEDEILTNNWNQFCDQFNVDEDIKIRLLGFFANSSKYTKEERKKFRTFMKRENFFLRLANGLPNRTIFNVYYRARVIFNSLKRLKDMSDSERKLMKSLYSIHNNKWTTIAQKMNCYPICVASQIIVNYNSNGEPYLKGEWSQNEDKKFIKAMKLVLNTNDLSDQIYTKNIPFKKIRDLANLNRSPMQCQRDWMRRIRWKLSNFDQFQDKWSKRDSSKLIYVLFKSNFDNECDIDWDFIKEKFIKITSFNNLMKNWRIIKSTVPEFENKTYKQIVNYLYDNFLPNFVKTDEELKELEDFYEN